MRMRKRKRKERERERERGEPPLLPPPPPPLTLSLTLVCMLNTSPCVGSKRLRVCRQNARTHQKKHRDAARFEGCGKESANTSISKFPEHVAKTSAKDTGCETATVMSAPMQVLASSAQEEVGTRNTQRKLQQRVWRFQFGKSSNEVAEVVPKEKAAQMLLHRRTESQRFLG